MRILLIRIPNTAFFLIVLTPVFEVRYDSNYRCHANGCHLLKVDFIEDDER
jgi:hypothetical protein